MERKSGSPYGEPPCNNGGGAAGNDSYYTVLGIRKDASLPDVRSAYRKLALKWHPDRWMNNPAASIEAKRRFQKIQEAYSVLSDKEKRSMYDAGFLDLLEEDEFFEYVVFAIWYLYFFDVKQRNNTYPLPSYYQIGVRWIDRTSKGMGDFLHDLMNMMDRNAGAEEESLEDLQKTFAELFGNDLANMMQGNGDPMARKRRARDIGTSRRNAARRNPVI